VASEQLKLVIDVATAQAVKETKNLAKAVRDVGSEEIDLRSAADHAADALDAASAAMIADLKRAESAAEALGRSLGPDLSAKIGDAKLDSFIADLRRMGLSFEEIEGNSDRFAASLRKIDESTGSIKNVEGAVSRLGHESDNSRSVLANMVGNSVQDLGALGGVAGSAGVMIGQLAEYASEGNIGLAGLASTAGPMLGLGLAVAGITKLMESAAEQTKFAKERVDGLTSALENTPKDSNAALENYYLGLGKIQVQVDSATDSMAKFGHGIAIANHSGQILGYTMDGDNTRIIDVTKSLTDLGVGVKQWSDMVQSTPEKVRAWGEALIQQGADQEAVNQIVSAAIAEQQKYADGAAAAATWVQFAGTATTDAMQGATDAIAAAADGVQIFNDKIAAAVGLQGTYLGTVDSLVQLRGVLNDGTKGWLDQQQAINGAQGQVLAYLDQLGGVPLSKKTEILALLSQGNVDGVVAAINEIVKPRSVYITMYPEWGGPMGTNPGYQSGKDFANDFNAAAAAAVQAPRVPKGGGSGGGGGKSPTQTQAEKDAEALKKLQDVEDNKYALGVINDAEYRKILAARLKEEYKYSDEYTAIALKIKGIDDKTAKDKAAKDKAAHDRAEKAKKDREEAAAQARRLADEEMQRQANQAIVNANIMGASYANIYTSADPNAVVNAIQQWQRRNGPVPIRTTG
jgi:hypothetical protein